MRSTLLRSGLLWLGAACVCSAQVPAVTAVVNGASFTGEVAPGGFISIFGSGLSHSEALASVLPLPLTLAGTRVRAGNVDVPLHYVSPGQVNALLPPDLATGTWQLTVSTAAGSSAPFSVTVLATAPALFTAGTTGRALAFDPDFRLVDTFKPGDWVILYATGLGPLTDNGRCVMPPALVLGGRGAALDYCGVSGYAGVYQLNAQMPVEPLTPTAQLVGPGQANSPVAGLPIASDNVRNAVASFEVLWPVPGALVTFAPALLAARLNVSFDIAPGAPAFTGLLMPSWSTVPLLVMRFDPVAGRMNVTAATLTAAESAGDLSHGRFGATYDFVSGHQLPGDMVPLARIPQGMWAAMRAVPMPNTPELAYSSDLAAAPGTRLELTAAPPFATFLKLGAEDAGKEIVRSMRLYVDGVLVAEQAVTFTTAKP